MPSGDGPVKGRVRAPSRWRHGFREAWPTVYPENLARFVYPACGFEEAGLCGTHHRMVAEGAA